MFFISLYYSSATKNLAYFSFRGQGLRLTHLNWSAKGCVPKHLPMAVYLIPSRKSSMCKREQTAERSLCPNASLWTWRAATVTSSGIGAHNLVRNRNEWGPSWAEVNRVLPKLSCPSFVLRLNDRSSDKYFERSDYSHAAPFKTY